MERLQEYALQKATVRDILECNLFETIFLKQDRKRVLSIFSKNQNLVFEYFLKLDGCRSCEKQIIVLIRDGQLEQ